MQFWNALRKDQDWWFLVGAAALIVLALILFSA
jgi:hypothetical protein